MNAKIIISGMVLLMIAGCTGLKKGDGGMLYSIIEDKNGPAIREGDFTALTLVIKTETGTVLYNSRDNDERLSFQFREKPHSKGDFFAALGLLSEGDSATVKIAIDSMVVKPEELKNSAVPGKYLIYTIKVNKVIARGKLSDSLYNSKIELFKTGEMERAKREEALKISSYLTSQGIKPVVTASGLNYVITKVGRGTRPVPGDTVTLQYTAMLLSGKVFETSSAEVARKAGIYNKLQPYGPRNRPVITRGVLSGFDEALKLFPSGTKAMLIIPSKLAYGPNLYKGVLPYTPLRCELEIMNVIHTNESIKVH